METEFDVNDPAKIGWVLKSLMQAHQLVDINFGKNCVPSQSIIVDVDLENRYFYVDEFPSAEANRFAGRKNQFDLRGALKGVSVKALGLRVEEAEEDEKGLLYRVLFPTSLSYMQRRDSYRVSIGYGVQISVDITFLREGEDADDSILRPSDLQASLYDISTTGCRLVIPDEDSSFSAAPGELWKLSFKLPEDESPLEITIETANAGFVNRKRNWQIGCGFIDIERATRDQIGRFVTNMQRLERSRQNGLG